MMRKEVEELVGMGPLPSEQESIRNPSPLLERYQKLLSSIKEPVTDEEAGALAAVFGVDECFGLGWTLLHLVETAPNWPIEEALKNAGNEWIAMLKDRADRWQAAGYPARSFYKEAGLPDPRSTGEAMRNGSPTSDASNP